MAILRSVILFFCLSFFIISCAVTARQTPAVDHIALYVFDLDKSVDFYKNVMGFEVIPEPFHDGRHVWFKIGAHSQLHIIKGAKEVTQHDINSHFAYHVPVLQKFMTHLDEAKRRYSSFAGVEKAIVPRPDGIKQIYLQDPDNYWIEVNDSKF